MNIPRPALRYYGGKWRLAPGSFLIFPGTRSTWSLSPGRCLCSCKNHLRRWKSPMTLKGAWSISSKCCENDRMNWYVSSDLRLGTREST